MEELEELTVKKFEAIATDSLLIRCFIHEDKPRQPVHVKISLFSNCLDQKLNRKVFHEIIYEDEYPHEHFTSVLGLKKRKVLANQVELRRFQIEEILQGWKDYMPLYLSPKPVVACTNISTNPTPNVIEISPSGLLLMQSYKDLATRIAYGIEGGNWLHGTFSRLCSFIEQRNKEWERTTGAIY